MSGICCDALNPAGRPAPAELRAAGADGGRLVAFDADQFFRYGQALLDDGLALAIVLASESFGNEDYAGFASFYAERIVPHYVLVGNEMDAYLLDAPSDSSWKLTPPEYAALWAQVAPAWLARQPDARLVIGGLVSGVPAYLDEVLPLLDPQPWGVDLHPYGRGSQSAAELFELYRETIAPGPARALFAAYRAVLDRHDFSQRRFLCLEWNRPAEEIADYERMLREETAWATWFCWSSGMVPGFGLIDEQGNPTAEYDAFKAAQEANTMTAIDERAAQLGEEKLGAPLGEEVEVVAGIKVRSYYNAVLVEFPGAGVYAFSEATVASKFLPQD